MISWFYYIGRGLTWLAVTLFARFQIKGRDNVPKQGPLLVICNHINLVDPPIVGISLPRLAIFMAKEELFRSRFTSYFFHGIGAFPVHRGKGDMEAFRQAERVLSKGLALVMFPEGKRSKDACLQPALSGSALVAYHSGIPILPVCISGTEKIRGAGWLIQRPKITVNVGHPFNLPPVNGKLSRKSLTNATDFMMMHIAELLPPEYQGYYSGQVKSNVIQD